MPTQQSKLLNALTDSPIDQLFQSAYVPGVPSAQTQGAGLMVPGPVADTTSPTTEAQDLTSAESQTEQGTGRLNLLNGGAGTGLTSLPQGTGPSLWDILGGGEGGLAPAGVVGPENANMSLADMLGLMVSPIFGPVAIAKAMYSAYTNATMPMQSQMSLPEALAILQAPEAYGTAPIGTGLAPDPYGGTYGGAFGDALGIADAMGMLGAGSYGGAGDGGSGGGGFGGGVSPAPGY